jgi:hypothetical protein
MHLSGFVWFNVMVADNARSSSSFSRWFSLLDLNGDGYLDRHDLKHFFDGKLKEVSAPLLYRPLYTVPFSFFSCPLALSLVYGVWNVWL